MIDKKAIFKKLWEHKIHEHAPISTYLSVLTKDEINYLLSNGYMKMSLYKDVQHYKLTTKGWTAFEIYTFGLWKYIEVKFLYLIGKVVTLFKSK